MASAEQSRKRASSVEVFWAIDRMDRTRRCAELVQLGGQATVICRTPADAVRVAGELSRLGVPAAAVGQRDFTASHIRAHVVTDDAIEHAALAPVACVVQFDPAPSPRRHRRRVDGCGTADAFAVTLVVPEQLRTATMLLADLDRADPIAPFDLQVAERVLRRARANAAAGEPHARVRRRAVRSPMRSVRDLFGRVLRRNRSAVHRLPLAGGRESTLERNQRAS